MDKLKPCPFCGSDAILDKEEIFCTKCGCRMEFHLYAMGGIEDAVLPCYEEAKQMAVESWNRRAKQNEQEWVETMPVLWRES